MRNLQRRRRRVYLSRENPAILLFPDFLSPVFSSCSPLTLSRIHGKRPCRALMRVREIFEGDYTRPPFSLRVYRRNKF